MDYDANKAYFVNYKCSNCGHHFSQGFSFGERASQGQCPNCGVLPIRQTEEWNKEWF
jgi:DNA-directed RNA polymerase subunit RPC12/RpoP